jgi:proteasome regulatory subunit
MTMEEDVDLDLVSALTDGASGADVKAICTEAGMFAIREERPIINMNDFLDAVDKIMGVERDEEILKEAGVMYG